VWQSSKQKQPGEIICLIFLSPSLITRSEGRQLNLWLRAGCNYLMKTAQHNGKKQSLFYSKRRTTAGGAVLRLPEFLACKLPAFPDGFRCAPVKKEY